MIAHLWIQFKFVHHTILDHQYHQLITLGLPAQLFQPQFTWPGSTPSLQSYTFIPPFYQCFIQAFPNWVNHIRTVSEMRIKHPQAQPHPHMWLASQLLTHISEEHHYFILHPDGTIEQTIDNF